MSKHVKKLRGGKGRPWRGASPAPIDPLHPKSNGFPRVLDDLHGRKGAPPRPRSSGTHAPARGNTKMYLFTDMVFGKFQPAQRQITQIENFIIIRLPGPYRLTRWEKNKPGAMQMTFARGKK